MPRIRKGHISAASKPAARKNPADQKAPGKKAAPANGPVRLDLPIVPTGKAIANSFWGQLWCRHLESFSDYANRLPRGRTYLRSGAVRSLQAEGGRIQARVSGNSVYRVEINIAPLSPERWTDIKRECAGEVSSLVSLLQGQLSTAVMRRVTDRRQGLFPQPGEMRFSCTCPDWADMCKHVAAVLFGVGNALDQRPDLLFSLRGVDPQELLEQGLVVPVTAGNAAADASRLADDRLAAIFGIDLDFDLPATLDADLSTGPAPLPPQPQNPPPFANNGLAVAALRQRLGMSRREFATALAVSVASVQRWESAQANTILFQKATLSRLQRLHQQSQIRA